MATQNTVEIRIIATGAQQAAQVLQGVAAAGAEVGRVTATGAARAQEELGRVRSSAELVGGSLRRATEAAAGFAAAVVGMASISEVMRRLGQAVVGTNAMLQQSTLQFQTLLGSADAAKQHVEELFKFAARTPFETGPIIQASRSLLTMGVAAQDVTKTLTLVGDAAATSGAGIQEVAFWFGRAYAAIQSGRPFGEATMRLQELGILSANGAVQLERLEKSGGSAAARMDVLTREFERFRGSMGLMANTWAGLTSTIADNLNLAIATGFRPFFDMLQELARRLATAVQTEEFTRRVTEIGDVAFRTFEKILIGAADMAQKLTPIVTTIASIMGGIATWFFGLPTWMQEIGIVAAFLGGQRGAIAALAVMSVLNQAQRSIEALRGGMSFNDWIIARPKEIDAFLGSMQKTGPVMDDWAGKVKRFMAELRAGQSAAGETVGGGLPPVLRGPVAPALDEMSAKAKSQAKQIEEALASSSQRLTQIANEFQGEDAKKVQAVADAFEDYARKVEDFGPKGAAAAAQIRTMGAAAVAMKEQLEGAKDTVRILDDMDLGLKELAAPLKVSGDLATQFALAGDDVTVSFGGATTATLKWSEAFSLMRAPLQDTESSLERLGGMAVTQRIAELTKVLEELRLNGVEPAAEAFQVLGAELERALQEDVDDKMRRASLSARVLGSDFDLAAVRVSALQSQFNDLVRVSQWQWTPEIGRVGAALRSALADQALYKSIEQSFLSVTDTFTKMADGLIQGTLDIGDAFANLGRNLLANFVQIVLHQVFDPILKEAAGFVSALVGMLTGRGGLIQGTGGAAALSLVGAVGGAFGVGQNFSSEQVAAIMQGGAGAGSGGSSILGTLGSVGSGLSSLYNAVAYVADLPSLLELTASGLTAVGEAVGLLTPALAQASVAGALLPEAGSAALTGLEVAGSGVAGGAGGLVGASGAALGAGLIGGGAMFAIVSLAGFLDQMGRAEIARQNLERRRAQSGFDVNLQSRLLAAEAGMLSPADVDTFHRDIGIMLQSAKFSAGPTAGRTPGELEGPAFNATETAKAFVAAAEAAGYQPVPEIDLGQGPMSTLSQASVDLLQRYTDLLAKGVESWQRAAEVVVPDFDRQGVIDELMGDLPSIALILDLPALAREGEQAADTFQRMVTALAGLESEMDRLAFDSVALGGGLSESALVLRAWSHDLAQVSDAIQSASIDLQTTQDPEKMLAAAQQLDTLIRQRYQLEIDAVQTLVGLLQQQTGALAGGFVALAQAAPTLRTLGLEVGGMTDALGAVVDLLREVGDTAGQLAVLRGQVGTVGGASPASILASASAFQRSLSVTVQGLNALSNAQERMAGLVELLGDLTAGYEAATAALSAHFDTLRQAEQDRLDESIRLVESYFDAQRSAWENLNTSSRQFEQSARRIRDQVATLRTTELSPLNPAEQLRTAQAQLGEALARFWVNPAADVADEVSTLAGRVLEVGSEVFSRPSPAFAALFDDITGTLEDVASATESRVTPEQEMARLLAEINAREAATLASLGVVADTNKAVFDRISGGLTVFAPNDEAHLATIVASGQAARANLDAIAVQQAAATETLRAGFAAVAGQVIGTSAAVWGAGSAIAQATWHVNGTLVGIWGTIGNISQQAQDTRADLQAVLKGQTVSERIDTLNRDLGQALATIPAAIHDSLEALVGHRIDALIAQGGTQAVVDALSKDGPLVRTISHTAENIWAAVRDLSTHLGLSPVPPRHGFAEGSWNTPAGPALLHHGEIVVPSGKSAAQWMREGGFMAPTTSPAPSGPVTVTLNVNGAEDPRRTVDDLLRELRDRGVDLVAMSRRR